jgi:hypothetical protein
LMVLAFATALGGGIIRDVLIGDAPPASLRDWRYAAVAFAGGAVVFFLHQFVQSIPGNVILVLDAAGLSLFAIAGAQKALVFGMHPFVAILLGTITGVGGGTARDVLLAQVPSRRVRDRGAGGVGGDDCRVQGWHATSVGGGHGRHRLLFTVRDQRLAALEFATCAGRSIPVQRGHSFYSEGTTPFNAGSILRGDTKAAMGFGVVGLLLTGLAGGDEVLVRPCAILQE